MSLDLLLALIPITIMLGLVAANMGNIMYDTQDTLYRSSLERVSADTVNTLLKTSGDPYNWENISSSQVKVVGLAKYDSNHQPIEYVLSPQKVGTLNATGPQAVQNIIGDQYGFYIVITPINSPETVIWNLTSNGTSKDAAKDVVMVQRDVIYGGFDIVSNIKGATHDGGKPQDWTAKDPFPTNKYYTQIYDYYVLIIDRGVTSASIIVNNHEVLSQNDFKGYNRNSNWTVPIPSSYLQSGTGFAYNNFKANFVASGGSMDVYVVQVPKGTPQDKVTYENARGQKYLFQFYAWTK
nr:hypothetical protein [uncultured Methanobacterium sp.]